MFNIFGKDKAPTMPQRVAEFARQLQNCIIQARLQNVSDGVICAEMQKYIDSAKYRAAVAYEPRKMHSGNLPR
jgi:hypothetical protein